MFSKIILMLLFLNFLDHHYVLGARNNVCKNFEDYFTLPFNENCYYDPDWYLETPELIEKHIGRVESYRIETEDDYILTMFRIPKQNSKASILLQPPLTSDSRVYVGVGNNSLAFYLWNAGYDIWLSNARGTKFSQGHKKFNLHNYRYWDFSFHEIGAYDIDSQIKIIKSIIKDQKLFYIGHSMAVTEAFIYASLHSQEAKNSVETFIVMGAPIYFKYTTSLLKLLLVPLKPIATNLIINILKLGNVLFFLPILLPLSRIILRLFPILLMVINVIFSLLYGWTPEEIDPAILNVDVVILLKSFSWKMFIHYLQLMNSETQFHMFDYGKTKNLDVYRSETPPLYPIENIRVPMFIIKSENDSLCTPKDSDYLYAKLSKEAQIYKPLLLSGLNHIDYFLGKHKKEIYYSKLLNFLNSAVEKKI